MLAQFNAGALLTTGLCRIGVFDPPVVGKCQPAALFVGRANANNTATIDVATPLVAKLSFVGQDGDFRRLP
jgi:hypothetical protein